ncbi:hypothetical protein Tco_1100158 [Tanacetum coccineum]
MAQFPKLTASEKTDIVCRVFEQKIKLLIAFLKKQQTFKVVTGDTSSKIQSPEDVDHFISAELPNPNVDPEGYKIVLEMMTHGPCGSVNLGVACMQGDKCSKKFPKKFTAHTFFDDKGHVHYQRMDSGVSRTKHQFKLDNSYVVLYNRDLLLAFHTHINVEYCGWSMPMRLLLDFNKKFYNSLGSVPNRCSVVYARLGGCYRSLGE